MDFEKLRALRNSNNPYAARLGIRVEEIREGYARVEKDITPEDLNPVGVPHGGVYFTMADTACGSAMAAHGYYAVTVSTAYNFLRSAKLGDRLTAEARERQARPVHLRLRHRGPGPGRDAAGHRLRLLLPAGPADRAVTPA